MTDTSLALLEVVVGLMMIQMLTIIPIGAWYRLGGHPEGTWRILRVDYFSYTRWIGDKKPKRIVRRTSDLKTNAPGLQYFDTKSGSRYYWDELNSDRINGRPNCYYKTDNPFPLPIHTMQRDAVIDSEKVNRAFHTDIVKLVYNLRDKDKKKTGRSGLRTVGIFIIVIIIGIITMLSLRGMLGI